MGHVCKMADGQVFGRRLCSRKLRRHADQGSDRNKCCVDPDLVVPSSWNPDIKQDHVNKIYQDKDQNLFLFCF